MKKYSFAFLFLLLFISCGDKKSDFKVEVQDVYAFEIEAGWELNINAKVEGFELNEADGNYKFDLKYRVDLINPNGKVTEGIVKGTVSEKSTESLNDFIIEAQAEIDSTYQEGDYKIKIYVEDQNSNQEGEAEKDFEIGF